MLYLVNPDPGPRARTKRRRNVARKKKRARSRSRARSRTRSRRGYRRNPPRAARRAGTLEGLLMLPVRGAATLLGLGLARTVAGFASPSPEELAAGKKPNPVLQFGIGAGAAGIMQVVSGMLPRGLREYGELVAGGIAAGATKQLVTAYWPESQKFLGRHDNVLPYAVPRMYRPLGLRSYARPPIPSAAGLSSYAQSFPWAA